MPQRFWDRPRSAAAVLGLAEIRPCIDAYLASPAARLRIRHAPGLDASLQAEEMQSWLKALAIDPERMDRVNDREPREPLLLEVVSAQ